METRPRLLIGQPAPLFQLTDLSSRPVALASFLGRPVLLNFWSAECPWVERTDAQLLPFKDRVSLVSIACNANEPASLIQQTALARGLPLVLLDPDQAVADLYGAFITPHLFLIDPGGVLRYQGAPDDVTFRRREPSRFYLQEALQAMLSGHAVSPAETPPYGCTIVRAFLE